MINFKRPKKDDNFPQVDSPFKGSLSGFCRADPIKSCTESKKCILRSLQKITPNAAVLTCVSLKLNSDESSSDNEEETDTASETEEKSIPELLTSFFDPCSVNYTTEKINEVGKKLFQNYKNNTSHKQYDNLAKITSEQSLSNKWMLYRAGRITSSNCKKAFTMNLNSPAVSTVKSIMQYYDKITTKEMKYGRDSEPKAFDKYYQTMKAEHSNFTLKNTGLHINHKFPYIGASPDGITSCDCHGKGLLEIKCPYNFRNGLADYKNSKNCPITQDNKMKESHEYYFQVQLQMLVTETKHSDFFVWSQSKSENESAITIRVEKNETFCKSLKSKIEDVFMQVILPELVTRKIDPSNEQYQKLYCYCQRPCFEPMIGCDNNNCKVAWFHYACVNLSRTPPEKKQWFCPDCRKK